MMIFVVGFALFSLWVFNMILAKRFFATVPKSVAISELELRARNAVRVAEHFGETVSCGVGESIFFTFENAPMSEMGNGVSVSIAMQIRSK